jgi:putative DNA primase/helicase
MRKLPHRHDHSEIIDRPPFRSLRVQEVERGIELLAALPPVAYEMQRVAVAKKFKMRTAALDAAVAAKREQNDATGGRALFREVRPWTKPIKGSLLLEKLVRSIRRFVVLPKGGDVALALWAVFAHAHDAASHSPILAFLSPSKRCGKTRALKILRGLVPKPLPTSNISRAALFRVIESALPTLLLDEADSTFGRGGDEEMRGILNSGHEVSTAYVVRSEKIGDEYVPRRFSTWSPKAIAAIGSLPPTLMDRSIILNMRRKLPGDECSRLDRDGIARFEKLGRQAARWAADHVDNLRNADPPIPAGLNDRAADNWQPLLAIADLAGGEWPARARKAVLQIEKNHEIDDIGENLLGEIRRVIGEAEGISSGDLRGELTKHPDSMWSEFKAGKPITQRQIAAALRHFKISPEVFRLDGRVVRGYRREKLADSFFRYLPQPPR